MVLLVASKDEASRQISFLGNYLESLGMSGT